MTHKIEYTRCLTVEYAEKRFPNFWRYNAINNNCQTFVKQLLSANNLWNKYYENFVIQDVSKILSNEVEKRLNLVTVTGNIISKLSHFMPMVNWIVNLRTIIKSY